MKSARSVTWLRPILLGAAVAAAALVGCGGGEEREFTAADFVAEMNANGAALSLGPVLTTNPDGEEIHTVTFTDLAPSATGEGKAPVDSHGSATLVVVEGVDTAREEFVRCEQAPVLTCFRAANAVLRIESLQAADQARITAALEAIGSPDD